MSSSKMPELSPEQLRYRCPLDAFKFETTEEIQAPFEIIGQDRAIKAIQLGLMVPSRGYNILVQGLTGTGKETTVKSILETIQDRSTEIPSDICYVNNFDDADCPIALYLPAGDGLQLRKEMDAFVDYLDRTVPAVLESDEFKERRAKLVEREGSKGREVIKEFEERIKKENFVLVEIRFGPMTKTELAPIVDGKPRPGEELEQMLAEGEIEREEYERVDKIRDGFAEELDDVLKHARDAERQISEALKALVFGFGAEIVNPRVQDLKARFPGERTEQFLEHLRHDVLDNLEQFVHKPETPEQAGLAALLVAQTDRFVRYRVNLLVDNSGITSPPIVVETHPTYKNLFGTVERSFDRSGQSHTDFTRIKAGSLLKAMGGYLVLSFHEVLSEPGVYQSLKRTLKNGKVDIQGYDPAHMFTASALKPEPIDVQVKVVLIGDAQSYQVFYEHDPDFRKTFKVKADFDTVMERTPESIERYAHFIARTARVEKLRPFDRSATAAVVEAGLRLSGSQNKLSTRFSDIADLLREANYWAQQENADIITASHIDRTLEERVERRNLIEVRISEMIRDGVIMISSDGVREGQVNGLSVYDLGDYRFGRPTRITASVATGRAGIINIERESDLSGRSHNKGMLILAGYLRSRFAKRRPMTLSASLAFEQSYSGVDGDSASSTELYALVSALSELPLRQDIAVTGSVNQKGEVQAIGGVNEKIEGFFDTCVSLGLTGDQGVMIPQANVSDLMLRKSVVEAVAAGKFHVYPVSTIEQGIEILTRMEAGVEGKDGTYPEASVYGKVERRLAQMARDLRAAARPEKEAEKDAETEKEGADDKDPDADSDPPEN
ncbi:MAG: ATP-dependent protease [Acidobacteria bacterium]|nr:MAG: ATP-dependent protease [Acidobacteriota bacterium]